MFTNKISLPSLMGTEKVRFLPYRYVSDGSTDCIIANYRVFLLTKINAKCKSYININTCVNIYSALKQVVFLWDFICIPRRMLFLQAWQCILLRNKGSSFYCLIKNDVIQYKVYSLSLVNYNVYLPNIENLYCLTFLLGTESFFWYSCIFWKNKGWIVVYRLNILYF